MKKSYIKRSSLALFITIFSISLYKGQNINYGEHFASCDWPEGWSTIVDYGGADWEIRDNNTPDPEYGDECVLLFLDNASTPGKGDSSSIWVYSPWVQPYNYDSVFIDFSINFVKQPGDPQEIEIFYDQGNGLELFRVFTDRVWGATFNDYVHFRIALDNSQNVPVRFIAHYDNHGVQNGVIHLDNIIFHGPYNDICAEAVYLELDKPCIQGSNVGASDSTLQDGCSNIQTQRPMWFVHNSTINGTVKLSTNAAYNEVVDVYFGRCGDLANFRCTNYDEYGFQGEDHYFPVLQGLDYFIRVSGYNNVFSRTQGEICVEITQVAQKPAAEAYDFCNGSLELKLGENCIEADNYFALTDGPVPSLNSRSRADIWFKYYHEIEEPLNLKTNANFSDVITIYNGSCFGLTEVTATVQGPDFEQLSLKKDQQYFIQITGNFATIEGDLCVSIEEAKVEQQDNDRCAMAELLTINDTNCKMSSTEDARLGTQKSSCQIYPSKSVWYEFVAPASGDIVIEVNADFLYDAALYYGKCDSLIEFNCQEGIHRCNGYLEFENLVSGATYYLQISGRINSLGHNVGDVCVSVYEEGSEPHFNALSLDVEYECVFGSLPRLLVNASGGEGQLSFLADRDDDIVLPGEKYLVIVEDESGCREVKEGIIDCTGGKDCGNSTLSLEVDVECEADNIGRTTGRIIIKDIRASGSSNYTFFGHQVNDIIEYGQQYKITVFDGDSCMAIANGDGGCKPFDCADSDLALNVDYDCIDSLFKARLNVTALNGNGIYNYSGHVDGQLLDNGDSYECIVVDEAGCEVVTTGVIDCEFDSCAYSNIKIIVDYECLRDNQGLPTGKAVFSYQLTGGIGALDITGNGIGDTLNDGETYVVSITDEWGCQVIETGEINCSFTGTHDLTNKITRIYPNPTNSWVMVEYESEGGNVMAQMIDQNGRIVFLRNYNLTVGVQPISMVFGDLADGVYTIKLIENDRISLGKLVLQN